MRAITALQIALPRSIWLSTYMLVGGVWAAFILYVELCLHKRSVLPLQTFIFACGWMLSLALIIICFSIPSVLRIKRNVYSALSNLAVSIAEFETWPSLLRRDFISQCLPMDSLAIYVACDWLRRPHEESRPLPRIRSGPKLLSTVNRLRLLKEVAPGYAWLRIILMPTFGSIIYIVVLTGLTKQSTSFNEVLSAILSSVIIAVSVVAWIVVSTIVDHLSRLGALCESSGISTQEFLKKPLLERQSAIRAIFPGAQWLPIIPGGVGGRSGNNG
jgi:hypothetical protein